MLVEINTDHFKWACGRAIIRLADETSNMPKHGDADRADWDKRKRQAAVIVDALALVSLTKSNGFWLDLPTYRLVCDDWPELREDGRMKDDGASPPVATVTGRSHALGLPPQKEKGKG